jgi:acetolactate decarboxylase
MKKIFLLPFVLAVLFIPFYIFSAPGSSIFQVSTLGALQEGVYDGVMTLNELKTHGDFGVGTFDGLDGEMVYLSGAFYQVRSDGIVYSPAGETTAPFADVVHFTADKYVIIDKVLNYDELKALIESNLHSKNIPCAILLEGTFSYVKTRSIPAQVKPYPRLADAAKNQKVFETNYEKGTILGFWMPDYFSGVNMPGFHLHFLNSSKTFGGHLLDCRLNEGSLKICYIYGFNMVLPDKPGFFTGSFGGDKKTELEKIEK